MLPKGSLRQPVVEVEEFETRSGDYLASREDARVTSTKATPACRTGASWNWELVRFWDRQFGASMQTLPSERAL